MWIGCKRHACPFENLRELRRPGSGSRNLPQQGQLPFADYTPGVIRVSADNTVWLAIVIGDGRVGERVVRFLSVTAALHNKQLRFDIGAFVPTHCLRQHRTDVRPDFTPDLICGAPKRPRMFATYDGLISVVVKVGQILTPPNPDGLPREQHYTDGGPQALGPFGTWSQWRASPIL